MMSVLKRRAACVLGLLCALSAGAACQPWSLPPKSEDALMKPIPVKRPLGQGALGQLVLQIDGSWALIRDKAAGGAKLRSGQLVHIVRAGVAPGEDAPRHLMVVVADRSWGAILQRLDAAPIPENAEVYALPREDVGAVRYPGACEGQGDPRKSACLQAAPVGSRWQLWPLTDARDVPLPDADDASWTLDATRLSVAHRDVDNVLAWDAAPRIRAERWIAMPLGVQPPPPVSIYAATGCPALSPSLAHTVTADFPTNLHPLGVEAASYNTLADVFVRCEDGRAHLISATLTRPPLRSVADEPLGPSVLAHAALVLPADAALLADAVDMFGALSRGDGGLADLFGERLLARLGAGKDAEEVGMRLAQLVAAAGRPEAALRLAQQASSGRWRRDGDVRWQLTQIAVWSALGHQREAAGAERDLEKSLGRRTADKAWLPWLYWRAVRAQLARGERVEFDRMEGLDLRWLLALRLLEALGSPDKIDALPAVEREALDGELGRLGAGPLWEAARAGQPAPATCADAACALDFYGRRLATSLASPDVGLMARVRAIGRLGLWPWTLMPASAIASSATLADAEAIALGATLAGKRLPDDALLSRLHDATASAERRAALCAPQGLRALAQAQPAHPDLAWLTTRGLTMACQGEAALLDEVSAHLSTPGAGSPVVWSAVRLWLLASPAPQRAPRLARAIKLAQTQRGEAASISCARLALAQAAAQLDAELVEASLLSLQQAATCAPERDVALHAELDALTWLAQRERSISDTGAGPAARVRLDQARQAARGLLPQRCVELFDARLTPVSVLDPWSAALAATLQLPAQDSEILTARRMERDAVAYVREAALALDRGDLASAAAKIATARTLFEQLGMTGAQARLDIVQRALSTPVERVKGKPSVAQPATGLAALKALDAAQTLSDAERAQLATLAILYHWSEREALVDRLIRAGACR